MQRLRSGRSGRNDMFPSNVKTSLVKKIPLVTFMVAYLWRPFTDITLCAQLTRDLLAIN